MTAITIRETKIATDASGTIVELHIADAPIGDSSGSFRLTLSAKLPLYKAPLLIHLQREAILEAREALEGMADALLQDLPRHIHARPDQI